MRHLNYIPQPTRHRSGQAVVRLNGRDIYLGRYGSPAAKAAANLGSAENLLRKWKQNLDAEGGHAFPGKGHLPALEDEMRRLRAENKCL